MASTDPSNRETAPPNEPQILEQPGADTMNRGKLIGGRYLIEKELGAGGIGIVYLARDQKLPDALVVIKVLRENLPPQSKEWIEKKFKGEITALSRIDHPGVVRALDVGDLPDGRSYLVMQYVAGESLRSIMPVHGMDLERVGKLMRQLGQALTAAHEQGIVHRDLKPENILLHQADDEEYAKLIDFGIATVREKPEPGHTPTTMVAGTMCYMAPEQLHGKPTPASDIYALGVIAYEMVTGRLPFNPDTPYSLLELQRIGVQVSPRALRPSLPTAAQAAILKALSFAQRDRYARAKDFGDALANAISAGVEQVTSPDLELAYVLFTGLVGYSSLTMDEQTASQQQLHDAVNAAPSFQRAQASGQLIRFPTGDGLVLVFFGDPLAPVKCAIEMTRALKEQPEIKLRMGLHTGPVQRATDANQNTHVFGGGVNIAQQVMEFGEAGHILISKSVAEVLSQLREWAGHLQDCGEQEIKPGVRIHLFNLHTDEAGNPNVPARIRSAPMTRLRQRWKPLALLGAMVIVAVIATVVWWTPATPDHPPAAPPSAAIDAPQRELIYSLTVRKNPTLYPNDAAFPLPGEIIFSAKDLVRFNISSPQSGYLYILNEGPEQKGGLPEFIVLFPNAIDNQGSAEIQAGRTIQLPLPSGDPKKDWIVFDEEEGVEKLWLIWSERRVPVLEAVKGRANPQDRGLLSDPAQIQAVNEYLDKQGANQPEVEKDDEQRQTRLKIRGEVLVRLLKLEHH